MQNKAPQGKTDPIPTPELELERYGVWVKAEPQDVIDEPKIARETLGATSVDGSDAVLLSEEEEDILDSFDLPEEPAASEEAFEEFEELSPLDEQESTPESPGDMEIFDFEALEPMGLDAGDSTTETGLDDTVIEDTVIDVPLDELDYEETAPEAAASPLSAEPASAVEETYQTTEISIDDFGLGDDDSTDGAPSLEGMGSFDVGEPVSEPVDEFETIDMDLQFDDTIPSAETEESVDPPAVASEYETVDLDSIGLPDEPAAPKGEPRAASEPVPEEEAGGYDAISLDSFIDDDTDGSSGIIPDLEIERVSISDESAGYAEASGFDDIKAVTDDLGAGAAEPSSDLLKQIASELSSIKEELVSLRSQLGSLKAAGATIPEQEPEPDVESIEEAAPGGFFDDEDDDTIALTGDELDNILNTADFTEEAADDESMEEPQLDMPEDIELLPEDGDYASMPEQGIETIEPALEELATEELIDLDATEGVTPLTSLPEDTSFLDEADDEEISELEGMPLDDVPLVEPDPSDLDILVDSAFGGEDEELPIIEAADEEPEIVLDIDADDEPVVSTVDSFPEPIEEVEEAFDLEELLEPEDLGGLDLHSEPTDDQIEELDEIEEEPAPFDATPVQPPLEEAPESLDDFSFAEPSLEPEPEPEPELEEILEEPEEVTVEPVEAAEPVAAQEPQESSGEGPVPDKLKRDVKSVLVYLDQLLASLPEEKIEEFASSEYYDTYKRLFDDLGLL